MQSDQNGLYYMRARYYNTDIKRFINRDTVSGDLTNSQSLNRYSYVQGNPVSLTDPFGLSPMGGDVMSILSQVLHTALDMGGLFWDGFDLINAAYYAIEKNPLMAASCAVAAIPFLGSMVAGGTKLAIAGAKAVKAADCIKEVSVMVGFTGMAVVGAINTAQAYKDYKEAKANGTATFSDELNVALSALLTVGAGVCALATATKMTTKIKSGGVGDSVKAAAKDNMSGSKGSSGKGASAGKGKGSTTDVVKLSKRNIRHIKKHTFDGISEQAKYLTDEQLANKLENTTFFNKNWGQDEVVKYTQEAYNILRSQGKTGLNSIKINGEIINVFINHDGSFDTAFGVYKYVIDYFR